MFKLFKNKKEKDAEGFEAYRKGFFDAFNSEGRWFNQNYYEGLKYKSSRRDYEDGWYNGVSADQMSHSREDFI